MTTMRAYAKVNLTLDVLGRRGDGYHEIDSIVQTVGLYDTITLERAADMRLSVEGFSVPADERNLIWQACVLVKERCGIAGAFSAAVMKHIPLQAGLGGGSSDAAVALVGAARLCAYEPPKQELEEMAAKLGSDVPFFLTGGTARMRGRGEIIEPLPDAPELPIVIVWPDFGVSTSLAYRRLDAQGICSEVATERAIKAVLSGDAEGLAASVSNVFEGPVLVDRPQLREIKAEMVRFGAKSTLLCGSGSAVFGIFGSAAEAGQAAERLRTPLSSALNKGGKRGVWSGRTVSRSEVREGLGWTR